MRIEYLVYKWQEEESHRPGETMLKRTEEEGEGRDVDGDMKEGEKCASSERLIWERAWREKEKEREEAPEQKRRKEHSMCSNETREREREREREK